MPSLTPSDVHRRMAEDLYHEYVSRADPESVVRGLADIAPCIEALAREALNAGVMGVAWVLHDAASMRSRRSRWWSWRRGNTLASSPGLILVQEEQQERTVFSVDLYEDTPENVDQILRVLREMSGLDIQTYSDSEQVVADPTPFDDPSLDDTSYSEQNYPGQAITFWDHLLEES